MTVVERLMGRVWTCTCGVIRLWQGAVFSSENSQQLTDWYSFTHVEHGVLFYTALARLGARLPITTRFLIAVAVESTWEVIENTPFVINRYRAATISLDYYGDSILNSMSDVAMMMLGFWLARRLPVWASVSLVVALELLLLVSIHDNLTLNILMLVYPLEAVRRWQAGG